MATVCKINWHAQWLVYNILENRLSQTKAQLVDYGFPSIILGSNLVWERRSETSSSCRLSSHRCRSSARHLVDLPTTEVDHPPCSPAAAA